MYELKVEGREKKEMRLKEKEKEVKKKALLNKMG